MRTRFKRYRKPSISERYRIYEAEKQRLDRKNLPPDLYEREIMNLSKRLGV